VTQIRYRRNPARPDDAISSASLRRLGPISARSQRAIAFLKIPPSICIRGCTLASTPREPAEHPREESGLPLPPPPPSGRGPSVRVTLQSCHSRGTISILGDQSPLAYLHVAGRHVPYPPLLSRRISDKASNGNGYRSPNKRRRPRATARLQVSEYISVAYGSGVHRGRTFARSLSRTFPTKPGAPSAARLRRQSRYLGFPSFRSLAQIRSHPVPTSPPFPARG